MFLLSVRAGLRACEIAGLEWSMVTDANGRVGRLLTVPDRIAKKEGGRRVPIHDELRTALVDLGRQRPRTGPLIASSRQGGMRANSVVNWFITLYAEIGAIGCSSHSGRRTFITHAARQAHGRFANLLRCGRPWRRRREWRRRCIHAAAAAAADGCARDALARRRAAHRVLDLRGALTKARNGPARRVSSIYSSVRSTHVAHATERTIALRWHGEV
jgi:hypothetical protein